MHCKDQLAKWTKLTYIARCPAPVFFTVAGEGLRLVSLRVKAGAMSTPWKLDTSPAVNAFPAKLKFELVHSFNNKNIFDNFHLSFSISLSHTTL